MRRCPKCKLTKEDEEFRKDRNKKRGLCVVCTKCHKVQETKWREINRENIRKRQRERYLRDKDKIKLKRKQNYDPIKAKARWLARKIEAKQCIFCEKTGERHHPDYSHPLDIVFLCKSHHKQVHDGTIKI